MLAFEETLAEILIDGARLLSSASSPARCASRIERDRTAFSFSARESVRVRAYNHWFRSGCGEFADDASQG